LDQRRVNLDSQEANMSYRIIPILGKWRLGRHPSAFLLAAQVLSLVLYAAFEGSPGARPLLSAVGAVILALAVWVVSRSPAANWIAWLLAVPAVVLSLLAGLSSNPTLTVWAALLEAALYLYTAGSLIAYMMGDTDVTLDELFAAGATFTLLAWGFAYLYLACEAWFPGCFAGGPQPERSRTVIEPLSLSSTNLSATGLGDILPVTPPARVLVMIEQFTGIGYVTVVVSRLVGMTLSRRKRRGELTKQQASEPEAKD
jgi:hypothetical protein